jgi:hypothetical protein
MWPIRGRAVADLPAGRNEGAPAVGIGRARFRGEDEPSGDESEELGESLQQWHSVSAGK